MSQGNFVIQDVVSFIDDEIASRGRRTKSRFFRKLFKRFWLFLLFMGVSSAIGYVAVYLPDSLAAKAAGLGTHGSESDMRSTFENLSEERKKELMEQFGGLQ